MQRFLLTNGLGGYASLTKDFTADRCDAGVFVAALRAPDLRINMVHGMQEALSGETPLSLQHFSLDPTPCWFYKAGDVVLQRQIALGYGENTCCVTYRIENAGKNPCTFTAAPVFKLSPKEEAIEKPKAITVLDDRITDGTYTLYISADAPARKTPVRWHTCLYPEDEKDGRTGKGLAFTCTEYSVTVAPGQTGYLPLVFSCTPALPAAEEILKACKKRKGQLLSKCPFQTPVARQLSMAADDFIVARASTGGKTIIAGYPLFSDWGRDTMIALSGCTLSTGRYEDAKSILKTFLAYEQDGLVPNLFPEGGAAPRYNTVDAALLLIDCLWQYYCRTQDLAFMEEAFPVMERIIQAYRTGTRHGIGMDDDGLIYAGEGLDQVTWMDVCVEGVLPTPRHGKPVEINAYWYNALKIMVECAFLLNKDPRDWAALAEKVKTAFRQQFWMEEKQYLKDVLSGTAADTQLRCNQIWAVSMSFSMLDPRQEQAVVETVARHLLTGRGLRTLSPEDPQYHGFYGGRQFDRDMAYHQGTTWVFPMGAWCRAFLKVNGNTPAAANALLAQLSAMVDMLTEGCIGQLPEIYDGDDPYEGKGCYAQAWSVGEMLRVYEELERIYYAG